MPSSSERQRKFMGAELARKRAGKKTSTGMSEQQLREFASSSKGGSLEDITFMENAATCDTVINGTTTHNIHKGYRSGGQKTPDGGGAIQWGADRGWKEDGDEPKGSVMSANRDNGYGIHYGAEVDYFGPDTDYRAEEINPQDYGRDWDPFPFRDMFKDEKKQTRPNVRLQEDAYYSSLRTPGTVTDSQPQAEAHGAVNWDGAGPDREITDYRSFDSQQRFRRNIEEIDTDVPQISGRDTKYGKKIR